MTSTGGAARLASLPPPPLHRRGVALGAPPALFEPPPELRIAAGPGGDRAGVRVSKRGRWCDVVAVGPNVRNVEAGDSVLLLPETGIEVEIRGEEYLLIREREIHAVASEGEDPGTGLYL